MYNKISKVTNSLKNAYIKYLDLFQVYEYNS